MNGYNPKFLGINIPFPEFSPSLVSSVLKKDALDQEIYVNYYNYTTVINRELRTPIFNAFNIDQSKLFNVKRKKNWDIDSRVGNENQLNEELTGLIFPDEIANKNPLFFNENEEAKTSLGVTDLPERIEVDSPQEIIATGQERTKVLDDKVPVYIAAALVNPSGDETKFEWISIINLSNKKIDLKGWKLKDPEASLELKGEINPGEAIRFSPLLPIQLGNRGGTISLFNDKGERIDRVKYPQQTNETEDVPVIFAMRDKVHVQVENVK